MDEKAIGIDEVGRGAWAGPLLVVAARQANELPDGLRDSKVLSKARRESLNIDIKATCDIGEGWVSPEDIDRLGLAMAMKLGVSRALLMLEAGATEPIIMDGSTNYCNEEYVNVKTVVRADSKYTIVSAASIVAKVARDNYMAEMVKTHPNYGFESHVGYGTKLHSDALRKYGITTIHRKSYAPIMRIINVN